jgi:NAD+ synthase
VTRLADDVLAIDAAAVAERIEGEIRRVVLSDLRRRGAVVGVSGGIDSSVVAALCTRALGPERTVVLLMPDRDSSADSIRLGRLLASHLGVEAIEEDITAILVAAGCYERQAEAIRTIHPAYDEDWRFKLTLPPILDTSRLNLTQLTVEAPDGRRETTRMSAAVYLQIVAATNFKQRTRTMLEYYHADRLGYAVAGTPNMIETDQGFFVKGGDGQSDLTPIGGLYKTQVFALARHLGLPEAVCERTPTTDTFSMPQTQEEFYFALPYPRLDLCLWAVNHGVSEADVAETLGLTPDQVDRVFRDIAAKRRAAAYLQRPPVRIDPSGA